jgi:hypothetical protein
MNSHRDVQAFVTVRGEFRLSWADDSGETRAIWLDAPTAATVLQTWGRALLPKLPTSAPDLERVARLAHAGALIAQLKREGGAS